MLDDRYEWTRVHAAAALWDIGGPPEADAVIQTLFTAWQENEVTSNRVLARIARSGPVAAPALPRIQAEAAQPHRSGRFGTVANDEELNATCRTVLTRLPAPERG
ncbi:hypothetical protein [Streptomyces sp. NPDC005281]|uniref:hypothetical protein n=1 Tax=Streptomyces sp. NPDC005281 TaxID=3155712 RepID=UPI0033B6C98D